MGASGMDRLECGGWGGGVGLSGRTEPWRDKEIRDRESVRGPRSQVPWLIVPSCAALQHLVSSRRTPRPPERAEPPSEGAWCPEEALLGGPPPPQEWGGGGGLATAVEGARGGGQPGQDLASPTPPNSGISKCLEA